MSLLEVKNLVAEFPGRRGSLRALDDISFSIAPGEILGVVGESGAGKSLTGAAIIGLLEPPGRIVSGQILLQGQRIDQLRESQLRHIRGRRIGAIFQDPLTSLNPPYTVGRPFSETIFSPLPLTRAHPPDRGGPQWGKPLCGPPAGNARRGPPACDRAAARHRHPGSRAAHRPLPAPVLRRHAPAGGDCACAGPPTPPPFPAGGVRGGVGLGRARPAEPQLIVADEPTTALDVSIQAQIITLLKSICHARGAAVMLITHDMEVIAEPCDRVAVLYAGRVAEIGPVHEVINQPAHPYTAGLMAAIPDMTSDRERLNQIDGAMPRLNAIPPGCAYHPRCPKAMERCRSQRPDLMAAGATRAACWLHAGATPAEVAR